MNETQQIVANPFLDFYAEQLAHQMEHDQPLFDNQPNWHCYHCLRTATGYNPDDFREVRKRFSYAVPGQEALDAIARYSPDGVVEIGAGGGYWASLLDSMGVDVDATDIEVPSHWFDGKPYHPVRQADAETAAREAHPLRSLLTVWPCYDDDMALRAAQAYRGDTILYIGEGSGGCTGSEDFHSLIGMDLACWHSSDEKCEHPAPLFEIVDEVPIPQWSGIHDLLFVAKRKPS